MFFFPTEAKEPPAAKAVEFTAIARKKRLVTKDHWSEWGNDDDLPVVVPESR